MLCGKVACFHSQCILVLACRKMPEGFIFRIGGGKIARQVTSVQSDPAHSLMFVYSEFGQMVEILVRAHNQYEAHGLTYPGDVNKDS